jgi:transposase
MDLCNGEEGGGGFMPKRGLRLTMAQERELNQRYQAAKAQKDLDMCLRIQGLRLVHRGLREVDAADTIGVGRRTLQDWIHRYRDRGISGLVKGPYPGGKSKLSEEQKADLASIIAAGPEAAGFESGVWIAPMVVKLVKDRYGVAYSSSQISRILHDLRFSVQYPTKRLSKGDEKAQKRWVIRELPKIKKKRNRTKAWCCIKMNRAFSSLEHSIGVGLWWAWDFTC